MRISGARYHRVATYSVMNGVAVANSFSPTPRASPKSHIYVFCTLLAAYVSVFFLGGGYLEIATLVDQEVAGLEIAVHDVGRVDEFKPSQDLLVWEP